MLRGSNLVSVTVFEIFRVKILTVHLLTLGGLTPEPKVTKRDTTYYPSRSTILQNVSPIAQRIYEICVTNVFHLLAPGGLTSGPKFTKRGDDLLATQLRHSAKFHYPTSTHARDIRYKSSADKQKNKQKTNSKRYIHNMPIGMCG